VDILVVDLQNGGAREADGLLAPPAGALHVVMLANLCGLLAPCGVMAVNAIGTAAALGRLADVLPATAHCTPPTHRSLVARGGDSAEPVSHCILYHLGGGSSVPEKAVGVDGLHQR